MTDTTSAFKVIRYDLSDGVAMIRLNRPEKLNAFTAAMKDELISALQEANADDRARAIVFTGEGRAYCAGADLSGGAATFDYGSEDALTRLEYKDGRIDYDHPSARDIGGLLTLALFESLKPVIGAINGPAVGIGATMLLPMDVRIASEEARFGFVFARRGVVPEAASSWFLPRIVGVTKALDWCLSGRLFGPQEARDAGLVSEVCEPSRLLDRAVEIARTYTSDTAPVSVALTRQMIWRLSAETSPFAAHRIDSRLMVERGMAADAHEGISSFLERRNPQFPDRVTRDMPSGFPWWGET